MESQTSNTDSKFLEGVLLEFKSDIKGALGGLSEDLREVKGDIKVIDKNQAEMLVSMVRFDDRLKPLEQDKQDRVERRKRYKTLAFSVAGTVIAAIIIYIFKLK